MAYEVAAQRQWLRSQKFPNARGKVGWKLSTICVGDTGQVISMPLMIRGLASVWLKEPMGCIWPLDPKLASLSLRVLRVRKC